jgi:hypothetical protein
MHLCIFFNRKWTFVGKIRKLNHIQLGLLTNVQKYIAMEPTKGEEEMHTNQVNCQDTLCWFHHYVECQLLKTMQVSDMVNIHIQQLHIFISWEKHMSSQH